MVPPKLAPVGLKIRQQGCPLRADGTKLEWNPRSTWQIGLGSKSIHSGYLGYRSQRLIQEPRSTQQVLDLVNLSDLGSEVKVVLMSVPPKYRHRIHAS